MADCHVITTLRSKIEEIERSIIAYEAAISKARKDLVALGLSVKVFEMEGGTLDCFTPALSVSKLFKRGEAYAVVRAALADAPEGLDTRQLAHACLVSKGYDVENAVLRKAMAWNLLNVLEKRSRSGQVVKGPKRKGVIVWRCNN